MQRGCHTRPTEFKYFKKGAPNGHFNLQRAVSPDWMGRIALLGHNTAFISFEYEREASPYKISSHRVRFLFYFQGSLKPIEYYLNLLRMLAGGDGWNDSPQSSANPGSGYSTAPSSRYRHGKQFALHHPDPKRCGKFAIATLLFTFYV